METTSDNPFRYDGQRAHKTYWSSDSLREYFKNNMATDEFEIIDRYWDWMRDLAIGLFTPFTDAQRRFMDVVLGKADPLSKYEIVYKKAEELSRLWAEAEKKRLEANERSQREIRMNEIKSLQAQSITVSCGCGGAFQNCSQCDGRGYFTKNGLGEVIG